MQSAQEDLFEDEILLRKMTLPAHLSMLGKK
jgi:hypothetical protein